jgi:hypothetical protein
LAAFQQPLGEQLGSGRLAHAHVAEQGTQRLRRPRAFEPRPQSTTKPSDRLRGYDPAAGSLRVSPALRGLRRAARRRIPIVVRQFSGGSTVSSGDESDER